MLIAFIVLQTVITYGASTTSKYTGSSYDHAPKFNNIFILDGLDVSGWNENLITPIFHREDYKNEKNINNIDAPKDQGFRRKSIFRV